MSGHSQSQSSLISILEIVRESFIIVSGGFCPRKMMFFLKVFCSNWPKFLLLLIHFFQFSLWESLFNSLVGTVEVKVLAFQDLSSVPLGYRQRLVI